MMNSDNEQCSNLFENKKSMKSTNNERKWIIQFTKEMYWDRSFWNDKKNLQRNDLFTSFKNTWLHE